ncbi:STAS domain-containing protein [Candidatus Nitrosacidococcus tergens]|uniref:Sulfate transporter / antisigma-factor antagonist STAS n=1 Tax=Candidatus Nitrosacidococcus tergens TaxID=553981 RepID=A0A7G1QBT9_9GAMM|nr:STAS domain-containing protein [Candidatus Nitrosacidococcus tergens]CAB1277240.1 Sulfate transporter / antisigma-factor antagonist STAS [Candidatus Nitrosacidococcus tergens]
MSYKIETTSTKNFKIIGVLTFDTVINAGEEGIDLFEFVNDIRVDLQEVTHIDSAGLVLLISWMRYARLRNKSLQFLNVSEKILALAKVSDLDQIIPFS